MHADNNQTIPEKRRGFHPSLVLSTIAVVIFVLWFCPYALMNARIPQTEKRAAAILRTQEFADTSTTPAASGLIRLTPKDDYTDYIFIRTTDNPAAIYAIPEYYNRTATYTFCLIDGEIFRKDAGKIQLQAPLPEVDDSWQK